MTETTPQPTKRNWLAGTFQIMGIAGVAFGCVGVLFYVINSSQGLSSDDSVATSLVLLVGGLLSFVVARFVRSLDR